MNSCDFLSSDLQVSHKLTAASENFQKYAAVTWLIFFEKFTEVLALLKKFVNVLYPQSGKKTEDPTLAPKFEN